MHDSLARPRLSSFLTTLLVTLGVGLPAAAAADASAARPNVVYILADDLGYGDVNLGLRGTRGFRNPYVKTPQLARLARQSLVFTDQYAAAPTCSPSRAGLLTGRTPTRQNILKWIGDIADNDKVYLRGEEVTVAEVLKSAGYATAVIGKWHLNGADWEDPRAWTGPTGSFPAQQGFDFALVSKENPHMTRALKDNTQRNPGDYFTGEGKPLGTVAKFSSELITDAAVDWMRAQRDRGKPFFLYLPYDAVHEIISSPEAYERLYRTGNRDKDAYYANVTFLDAEIGRLLRALDDLGLAESTVVFFSSDNGPDVLQTNTLTRRSYGTAFPLHGHKRQLYEGGIRVPGLVRWPGRIRPGISALPNSAVDVLPTLAELAGAPLPQDRALDGVSLVPHLLEGREVAREKPLYWQVEMRDDYEVTGRGYDRRFDGRKVKANAATPQVSVREGRYVLRGLHSGVDFAPPQAFVLFDVVADPEERRDLSRERPEVFQPLLAKLRRMHGEVNAERAAGHVMKTSARAAVRPAVRPGD